MHKIKFGTRGIIIRRSSVGLAASLIGVFDESEAVPAGVMFGLAESLVGVLLDSQHDLAGLLLDSRQYPQDYFLIHGIIVCRKSVEPAVVSPGVISKAACTGSRQCPQD